jgi:hypothetical protein
MQRLGCAKRPISKSTNVQLSMGMLFKSAHMPLQMTA